MKKSITILGALLFALFTLISCGPPDPNKGACNCQEIEGSGRIGEAKKDGKPYTGLCVKRDQKDSIIQRIEFKNGYTSLQQDWIEVYGNYILCAEVTAFLNKDDIKDGWKYDVIKNMDDNSYKYVSERTEYVDGKPFNKYKIYCYPEEIKFVLIYYKGNYGQMEPKETDWHPSCLTSFTPQKQRSYESFDDSFPAHFSVKIKNPSEIEAVLECLKKEVQGFNYWRPSKK